MEKRKKVEYVGHSKWYYICQILLSVVTMRFLVDMAKSFAFYQVNHSLGIRKAKIGKGTKVHATVVIREGENVEIGENCMINHNDVLQGGKANAKIKIGNFVQFGPNVMIFAFNHGMELNGVPMIQQDYLDADVTIEDDVWIGAGSVVTAGVHIGRGCIIGAGSVVTKDMPSNWVCTGIPCRPIKERR